MDTPKGHIVLVQPPIQDFYLTRKRTIPYGLAAIAENLEANSFSCTIVDGLATDKSRPVSPPGAFDRLDRFYGRSDLSLFSLFHGFKHFGYSHEHIASLIRDQQPFLVGISSLFTAYSDQALETATMVKKFQPACWVVLGGHHPTAFPETVLAHPDVDFVIQGEGETPMAALASLLAGHPEIRPGSCLDSIATELTQIPGLAWNSPAGISVNAPHWEPDLDALPFPDQGNASLSYYRRHGKTTLTIVAGRGCPFKCSYCSVSARSCHGPFRQRSVSRVLDEIRRAADQTDIGFIDFEDENLTLNRAWALELLEGIREIFGKNPVELRAMNGLYPPSLDKELIVAMKAAGFRTLNLSLGTFSKDQLAAFGRPDVRIGHRRAVTLAREAGMDSVTYIIGAAPGQDPGTTLTDLISLAGMPTLAGLSIFYPAPGSPDFDLCREKGLLPTHFSLMRSSALPLDHLTSRIQAVTLLRLSRIMNFIKGLADQDGSLPTPLPFSEAQAEALKEICPGQSPMPDRRKLSRIMVQWFLHDAIIRGIDREGQVYAHQTDQDLCREFINELKKSPFMGVTTGSYEFTA